MTDSSIESRPPGSDLPHREPFLFVTRVVEVLADEARAEWTVTGQEAFLRGHFPDNPVVPGVLIGEALAQTAGVALASRLTAASKVASAGFLARIEIRFHLAVRPPATISLHAVRTGGMGALHQFDVEASTAAGRVAHGSLVLSAPSSRGDD